MEKVKFNVAILDMDTRIEYPKSDEFVEVSEAFAKRLLAHDQHNISFVVEGNEADEEPDEKQLLRDEYFALIGEKAGNKGIDTMKAEIEAFKLANPPKQD